MSKYTTEVRYICEVAAGYDESAGYSKVKEILPIAAPKVFDFDFPIFDEDYRLALEIKILRHYYTREICAETVGLWKLWLEDKMNLIMPYYNQLYKSALLDFNPFYDVDVTRDHTKDGAGENENIEVGTETRSKTGTVDTDTTGTENTTTNGNRWDLYSDTPQGGINGLIDDNDPLTANNYLTNATRNIDTENQQTNTTGTLDTTTTDNENNNARTTNNGSYTNTEDYLEHVKGKQGSASYSKMLMEFRETFLNIDKMIIDELAPLFFNLW